MSSGRKSITRILCEASPQNNPEVHDFLIAELRSAPRHMRDVGCGFFEERCQSLRSDFKRTGGSGFCFDAFLDAGHEIVAYTAGKMKKNRIKTLAGDRVTIEMSPYDLEKGRLIFRHKDERPGGGGGAGGTGGGGASRGAPPRGQFRRR